MRLPVKSIFALSLAFALGIPASARVPTSCSPGPFILFFDHGSARLDARSTWVLDNVVEQRGNCGSTRAIISGHTDTSEPRSLSRKRAVAARAYMAGAGLPLSELTIYWFGSDKPRVPTPPGTREGQNRRVEIIYAPSSQ